MTTPSLLVKRGPEGQLVAAVPDAVEGGEDQDRARPEIHGPADVLRGVARWGCMPINIRSRPARRDAREATRGAWGGHRGGPAQGCHLVAPRRRGRV